jgi:hypothetical protein
LATSGRKKEAFLLERLCAVGPCGLSLRALGGERAGEVGLTRLLNNPRVAPAHGMAVTTCLRPTILVPVAGSP